MSPRPRPFDAHLFWLVAISISSGCHRGPKAEELKNVANNPTAETSAKAATSLDQDRFWFQQLDHSAGFRFSHFGGPSEEYAMTEQNGGGIAIFDYDNNEVPDLFFVNGSHFDHPASGVEQSSQMFQALGELRYQPVTTTAGLTSHGFGMGPAAGDFDNDGFCDLFVAYHGQNRLFQNNGDGTFADRSSAITSGEPLWGTSAAFADLDDDGNLDLYVVNYVEWNPQDQACFTKHTPPIRITCGPIGRPAQKDQLFHNNGDGTFRETGEEAGIANPQGKGLALAIADLNDEGLLDIYIANDTTSNSLYENQGGGRFEDVALQRGVATDSRGKAQAGMGVGCADYNRDGRLDLCVTNFENEVNDFYENLGDRGFLTRGDSLGLDLPSRPMLSFGIVMTDFDMDGWADLFVSNGHIWDLSAAGLGYQYHMPAQIWRNRSAKKFQSVGTSSGAYFEKSWLGRAVAHGDLDNDGDPDLAVAHVNDESALLRNDTPHAANVLTLTLVGRRTPRDPLGRSVTVRQQTGVSTTYWIPSGGSFQASSDPKLLMALPDGKPTKIVIHWSAGSRREFINYPASGQMIIVEPLLD